MHSGISHLGLRHRQCLTACAVLKNYILSQDLQLDHQNHPTLCFLVFVVVVVLLLLLYLICSGRQSHSPSGIFESLKGLICSLIISKCLFFASANASERRWWNSTLLNLLAMYLVILSSMSMIGFLNPPDLSYIVLIFGDSVKAGSPLRQSYSYREQKQLNLINAV